MNDVRRLLHLPTVWLLLVFFASGSTAFLFSEQIMVVLGIPLGWVGIAESERAPLYLSPADVLGIQMWFAALVAVSVSLPFLTRPTVNAILLRKGVRSEKTGWAIWAFSILLIPLSLVTVFLFFSSDIAYQVALAEKLQHPQLRTVYFGQTKRDFYLTFVERLMLVTCGAQALVLVGLLVLRRRPEEGAQ